MKCMSVQMSVCVCVTVSVLGERSEELNFYLGGNVE